MKPILFSPGIIDKAKTQTIKFKYGWSGETPISLILKIEEYNKAGNVVNYFNKVYENYIPNFDGNSFSIPNNLISFIADSGNAYRFYIKLRYKEPTNDSTKETDYSLPVSVYFFTTPVITIDGISDGSIIKRSSYLFGLRYSSQSPSLSLKSHSIGLYDSNKNLIMDSGDLYKGESFTVNGLVNKTTYYVKADGIAWCGAYEMLMTTGFIRINVNYDLQTLSLPVSAKMIVNGTIEVTMTVPSVNSSTFSAVKLKRRENASSPWFTCHAEEIDSTTLQNTKKFYDIFAMNGKSYQYILVPVYKDGAEGGYENSNMSNYVQCRFDGVCISGIDATYNVIANLKFNRSKKSKVSTIETIGGKYPRIIKNSKIGYYGGSLSGFMCEFDCETNKFNIENGVNYRTRLNDFLSDGMPKVLKTYNGIGYIIEVSSDVDESDSESNTPTTSFNWVQIGEICEEDIAKAGFIGGL